MSWLGCDFLIASERAVFADTHARVGVLPGGADCPAAAACRSDVGPPDVVCRRGDHAERALRIGLVTELVAHERLLDRAVELAAMVAEVPAETMRAMKDIYVSGAAGTVDAGSRPSGQRRPSTGRTLRCLSSGG